MRAPATGPVREGSDPTLGHAGTIFLTKDIGELKMHKWFEGINWDAVQSCKYKPPFVPILKSDQDTTYFSAAITSSSL